MSNAMRSGKRALAGVAAGALGAALLPMLALTPATAAVSSVTAGGPLRAAGIASNAAVDDSAITAVATTGVGQAFVLNDAFTSIALVSAPGITVEAGTAVDFGPGVAADDSVPLAAGTTFPQMAALTADDSFALVTNAATGRPMVQGTASQTGNWYDYATGFEVIPTAVNMPIAFSNYDDTTLDVFVSTAGTYNFVINGTYSWSFTTTGAPASFTIDPTSTSIVNMPDETQEFEVSVLDSNGAATQLVGNETMKVVSSDDSLTMKADGGSYAGTPTTGVTLAASNMKAGANTMTMKVLANAAGTSGGIGSTETMTVEGGIGTGTLSSVAMTVSTVATATTTAMVVSTPSNAKDADSGSGTGPSPAVWYLPPGATTIGVTSTLSTTATTDKVQFTAWTGDDSTASANLLEQKVETATGGTVTNTFTVAPTQAVNGAQVLVTDGTKWIQITYANEAAYFDVVPDATVRSTAYGASTTWTVGVATQYGNPLSGYTVKLATSSGSRNPSKSITATTAADGTATVVLPDSSTSTTNTTDAVTITAYLGASSATCAADAGCSSTTWSGTVSYSTTGAVTLTNLEFDGVAAASYEKTPVVPYANTIGAAPNADNTNAVKVTATASVKGTPVTFAGPTGAYFYAATSGSCNATTLATVSASNPYTVASGTSDGVAVACYYATKTGMHDITATSTSDSVLTGTIHQITAEAAARDISMTIEPASVQVSRAAQVKVVIKDGFGNNVIWSPTNAGQSVSVQTNLGSFGGSNVAKIETTDDEGNAILSLVSGVAGLATVKATGTGAQFKKDAEDPVATFAASVYEVSAPVEFVDSPTTQSITIQGSRETIDGQSTAVVDGVTVGFAEGDRVQSYRKLPGQTSYSAGSRPTVDADGEFYWQRIGGKKVYVFFKSLDGMVKSNRVIIEAK